VFPEPPHSKSNTHMTLCSTRWMFEQLACFIGDLLLNVRGSFDTNIELPMTTGHFMSGILHRVPKHAYSDVLDS
jgi:hypothetical protein